MSRLPYHRREHGKFLNGGKLLNNEEYGAYSRICDLIYDNEGPIDDDAIWLSGQMRCSQRRYRSVRDRLISHGKITIRDGKIWNERCSKELDYLANLSRNQSERASNAKPKSSESETKANKINGVTQAAAQPTETETETSSLRSEEGGGGGVSAIDPAEWRMRIERAIAFLGPAANRTTAGLANWAPLRMLTEPPSGPACDWELDVLPAISAVSAGCKSSNPLRSWAHPAIAREALANRDRRLDGLPALEKNHAQNSARNGQGSGSRVAAAQRLIDKIRRSKTENARGAEFDGGEAARPLLVASGGG